MKRKLISNLVVFFTFTGLLGCEPDSRLTGVASGAKGWYVVTAYIVSGDTLFFRVPETTGFKTKTNKIDVDNFTVSLEVIDSDQLRLTTSYWKKGVQITSNKEVTVKLTNSAYEFYPEGNTASSVYEGRVGRFTRHFYERTVGGLLISPADSTTNPGQQDVIIIAKATG